MPGVVEQAQLAPPPAKGQGVVERDRGGDECAIVGGVAFALREVGVHEIALRHDFRVRKQAQPGHVVAHVVRHDDPPHGGAKLVADVPAHRFGIGVARQRIDEQRLATVDEDGGDRFERLATEQEDVRLDLLYAHQAALSLGLVSRRGTSW